MNKNNEIFSYHLIELSFFKSFQYLLYSYFSSKAKGANHSEAFFAMELGSSIINPFRYKINQFAYFVWWSDEKHLEQFLAETKLGRVLDSGWHVRMKLYRKWGKISELENTNIFKEEIDSNKAIVAVTLARLKVLQTPRFIWWGKPVEKQIRDHKEKTLAIATMRPINTLSTFSVWKNEQEMTIMVNGRDNNDLDHSHELAMKERARKSFHHEFATMRFIPLREFGEFKSKSKYIFNN